MENLEQLLTEENSIKDKISQALKTLKQWFLDKIDQVKELFTSIKSKIMDKIKGFNKDVICNKDIKDETGHTILSKGDSLAKAKSKISVLLGKLKKNSDDTIKECKDGVISVSKFDTQGATEKKSSVTKRVKIIRGTIIAIIAVVGSLVGVTHQSPKNEKVQQPVTSSNRSSEDIMEKWRNEMK